MFIVQEIIAVVCIVLLIDILQLCFFGLGILIYWFISDYIRSKNN